MNLEVASAPSLQNYKCRKMARAVLDGRKELERAAVEKLGLPSFAVTRSYEVLIDQVGAMQGSRVRAILTVLYLPKYKVI